MQKYKTFDQLFEALYYMCNTLASTQSSNIEAHHPSLHGQYGRTWMLAAVKEWQESDRAQLSPCAELQDYLKGPLEIIDDVVGWWGVCFRLYIQITC